MVVKDQQGSGQWSGKVNPERAKREQAQRELQDNVIDVFEQLFGKDEQLDKQMRSLNQKIGEDGLAMLAELEEQAEQDASESTTDSK